MFIQHPIYPLIFSVILAAVIIKQCIVRRKFLKNRLVLSFILIFLLAMCLVFYDSIQKNDISFQILNYSLMIADAIIAVFFFLNIDISLSKEHFQREVVSSLDKSDYYLFINKKGKISEISTLLANKFNINKEESIGKNIKDVLDDIISIQSINDVKTNNEDFFNYVLSSTLSKDPQKLFIKFLRQDKTEDQIEFVETPIYVLDKYSGRMYMGKTNQESSNQVITTPESTMVETRFKAIIESSQEGVMFIDLERNNIWCNDYLVENLGLIGNTISTNDYYLMLNKDDYDHYKQTLNYLTPDNPKYNISYRFSNDCKTMIIKEEGKVLFNGLKPIEICSTVKVFYNKGHMKTNISLIDSLEDENHLYAYLSKLGENKTEAFEVVYLRLKGIPEINDKYGRQIGNMVIEEYIASFQKAFANNDGFFRISGLDFAFVITDLRKMEQFKRVLLRKNILTPDLTIGSVTLNMDAYMGISYSNDAIYPKDIYINAKNSLKKAIEDEKHFCFYHDLKY